VPSHASVQISVWFFVVITAFSRNIALRKRSLNMGCMLSRGVIRTHVEKQRAVISMYPTCPEKRIDLFVD
jgi:hypothetical protein